MIVYPRSVAENDALKLWIEQRIPEYKSGKTTACVGIERQGHLVAVVAWDAFREGVSVDVSIAADNPRWATKQTVRTLLFYAFGQLKVRRINSYCRKGNKRARRLNEGLGFVLEGKLRDACDNGEPLLVFGMTRKDFREKYVEPYLRKVNGSQEATKAAAAA